MSKLLILFQSFMRSSQNTSLSANGFEMRFNSSSMLRVMTSCDDGDTGSQESGTAGDVFGVGVLKRIFKIFTKNKVFVPLAPGHRDSSDTKKKQKHLRIPSHEKSKSMISLWEAVCMIQSMESELSKLA